MSVAEHVRRVVAPAMVGRDRELDLLAATVATTPALVVLEGEAGIGKSRLVAELAARLAAARPRLRVLLGRSHRVREPFPLGPMLEAVRGLGGELGRLGLSPLAGVLRPLLPELAGQLPPALEPLGDAAAERHRMFRALVEVLTAAGPTVMVLEDLHWADDQTVEFLGFLVDDQPRSLALVLTLRGEEAPQRLHAITARPPSSTTADRIELSPLGVSDTATLAASILATESISEGFAAHLFERTEGVPFVVEEVVSLLRERGALEHRGPQWELRSPTEPGVPTAVARSVRERADRLPEVAQGLLEAAAVLETTWPEEVVLTVAGLDGGVGARAIREALASGLVQDVRGGIGFRHVLAAEAVYEGLAAVRKRELHGRAADILAAVDPCPLGQLVHHLKHADRVAEWVRAAERAADHAATLGHDTEAARLLVDVLRRVRLDTDHRGRIAVKLARAAVETLHITEETTSLLEEMLQEDLPRVVRGELALRLALLLHQVGGDPRRQRQLYAQAVENLDDRPDLKAWAMVCLGIPMADGTSAQEGKAWLTRALEMLPAVDDPEFEVFLLGKAAMVLVSMGDPGWRPLAERVEALTGGSPRQLREIKAYYSIGLEACYVGHLDTAHRLLTRALDAAIAGEQERLELMTRAALALCDFRRGDWEAAGRDLEVLLAGLADYPSIRLDPQVIAGCLALASGDADAARRALTEAVSDADRLGAFEVLAVPTAALARAALLRGDGNAISMVSPYLEGVERQGAWASAGPALPAAVDALAAARHTDQARELIMRYADELRELDVPLAPAVIAHANGILAGATGDHVDAALQLLQAAKAYESVPCRYEAAVAREDAAVRLFAAEDARAEETLRAAMDAYERLGASRDAARCARVGRAHGVRVPVPHRGGRRGYGAALSPREAEVARIAADGCTNKEIAELLFLSPATVDKHLGRAMQKLGVHSRRKLRTVLEHSISR